MSSIHTVVRAKLLTGEIVIVGAASVNRDGYSDKKSTELYTYVGQGHYYSYNDEVNLGDVLIHFWVIKQNYNNRYLSIGDKFLVYIKDRHMMGPSVEGIDSNLTWVVYAGMIGETCMCNAYFQDGTSVGMPISSESIVYVEEGNTGISLIQEIEKKDAIKYGTFYLANYVKDYEEMPLTSGMKIVPVHNYAILNKNVGVRNKHNVLRSNDLVFHSWKKGSLYVTVKSKLLNEVANIAIEAINIRL